jgi:hypothetical protein
MLAISSQPCIVHFCVVIAAIIVIGAFHVTKSAVNCVCIVVKGWRFKVLGN